MSDSSIRKVSIFSKKSPVSLRNDFWILAVVILDREYYIQEILAQLSDVGVYLILDYDPLTDIQKEITSVINKALLNKVITKELATFLIKKDPITSVFYKNLTALLKKEIRFLHLGVYQ